MTEAYITFCFSHILRKELSRLIAEEACISTMITSILRVSIFLNASRQQQRLSSPKLCSLSQSPLTTRGQGLGHKSAVLGRVRVLF